MISSLLVQMYRKSYSVSKLLHIYLEDFYVMGKVSYSVCRGAPVAQWVKRWPTDLADRVQSPLRRNLLNRKRSSIAHSLSLSASHRPDMTETLLKRT